MIVPPPSLGIYVHLPWCVRKCPYCDFNSHPLTGPLPEEEYVAALLCDIERATAPLVGRKVDSVFFGGGTPSLFSATAIARVLEKIAATLDLAADAEITLEANPGTSAAEKFRAFRSAGVTRLSLGVQSFADPLLAALGRIHDALAARAALDAALSHFDRVNVDLMYGLPGQTGEAAARDVAIATRAGAQHVSAYQLTLESNTAFGRTPPVLPDEDTLEAIEQAVHGELQAAGLARYEVSAFAYPGHACRHNLNYWHFGDYLGVGAGAHGKLTQNGEVWREMRLPSPRAYSAAARGGNPVARSERVAPEWLPFEFMMNALRLTAGFRPAEFCARTGQPWATVAPVLAELKAQGLVSIKNERSEVLSLRTNAYVCATPLGLRFLNEVLARFLPEEAAAPASTASFPASRPTERSEVSRLQPKTCHG